MSAEGSNEGLQIPTLTTLQEIDLTQQQVIEIFKFLAQPALSVSQLSSPIPDQNSGILNFSSPPKSYGTFSMPPVPLQKNPENSGIPDISNVFMRQDSSNPLDGFLNFGVSLQPISERKIPEKSEIFPSENPESIDYSKLDFGMNTGKPDFNHTFLQLIPTENGLISFGIPHGPIFPLKNDAISSETANLKMYENDGKMEKSDATGKIKKLKNEKFLEPPVTCTIPDCNNRLTQLKKHPATQKYVCIRCFKFYSRHNVDWSVENSKPHHGVPCGEQNCPNFLQFKKCFNLKTLKRICRDCDEKLNGTSVAMMDARITVKPMNVYSTPMDLSMVNRRNSGGTTIGTPLDLSITKLPSLDGFVTSTPILLEPIIPPTSIVPDPDVQIISTKVLCADLPSMKVYIETNGETSQKTYTFVNK